MSWRDVPCKVWTRATSSEGYGVLRVNGKLQYIHRMTWIEAHGEPPPGHDIDHQCQNRACYELTHLQCITHAENVRLGFARNPRAACSKGHAWTTENTGLDKRGRRFCRQCSRENAQRQRSKRIKVA